MDYTKLQLETSERERGKWSFQTEGRKEIEKGERKSSSDDTKLGEGGVLSALTAKLYILKKEDKNGLARENKPRC